MRNTLRGRDDNGARRTTGWAGAAQVAALGSDPPPGDGRSRECSYVREAAGQVSGWH